MKTNKLTYSTPIPKIKEYVRNVINKHNAGAEYPCSLNEISQLFLPTKKRVKTLLRSGLSIKKTTSYQERRFCYRQIAYDVCLIWQVWD